MNTKPEFHGSDLEKVSEYYGIQQESILNFGANVNPLGLSETVRRHLADHLDVITTYPDRDYVSLRRTIADYCDVDFESVLPGSGSTELISLLIEQAKPKKALLIGPTYSEYSRELSFTGAVQQEYHLNAENHFRLDTKDLFQTLDDSWDLLILCNPNNPTSSALCTEELRTLISGCRELGIFVMIDETYVEFAPDVSAVTAMPLTKQFDNLMVLRGVSKFFAAPGLRLGYGVTGNRELLAHMKEHQNPWSLNSLGALAGEFMFQDTDYIRKTRELILEERGRILDALKKIPGLHPFDASANFILVRILKEGLTSTQLFEHCIRKGLMIRDCSSFKSLNGEYFRFCILLPKQNDRLLDAIREFMQ